MNKPNNDLSANTSSPTPDTAACLTCKQWNPKESGDMAKQHFSRCNLEPRWSYYPPLHSCKSYSPAEPQIIKARKAWEAK